jgi:putative transposase
MDYETLSHSKWDCKYHVVFIPKYRRKALYAELRRHLGAAFRTLAEQKESRIEEGHLMVDHVHMLISIPPKYAVANVVGFIKGKSAIHIARTFMERKRNFVGQHFWARGYFVSTVGRDEAVIRRYIRNQEAEDKRATSRLLLNFESGGEVMITQQSAARQRRAERWSVQVA